jgi:hypothetical protein
MCGFDVTPASGSPYINVFTGVVLRNGRSQVVGPYKGDYLLNWQGAGTWFADNPEAIIPWSITAGGLRYNDSSGGGGGGYRDASPGFSAMGGN